MQSFWNLLPTSTKLLAVATALMIVVLFSFVAFNNSTSTPTSTPLPLPQKLNVIQRGIPNVPIGNIEPQLNLVSKEASSDGSIVYNIQSGNPMRPDQLITKDGIVLFERIYIPEEPSDPGYMTLTEVEEKYGPAELVEQGSVFWGGFFKTYIYASKGYAFIANPHTKEVFEMHTFIPQSGDDYKKLYGADIKGTEQPVE